MAENYGTVWRYPLERQHVVRNPIIFNKDIELQRRMFTESAISTGVIVDFYNCISDVSDIYNDPNALWDEAVKLPIIFDDAPKVKILKNYGWFTEDDERPTLAYLPMYKDWQTKELLDVRDHSLLRVYYFGQPNPAEFRVTDRKMDSIYGVYWVCKLAPERFNRFYLVNDHGKHFLKVKARPDEMGVTTKPRPDNRVFEHDSFVEQIAQDTSSGDYWDMIMGTDTENTVDFYNPYESSDKINPKDD